MSKWWTLGALTLYVVVCSIYLAPVSMLFLGSAVVFVPEVESIN